MIINPCENVDDIEKKKTQKILFHVRYLYTH